MKKALILAVISLFSLQNPAFSMEKKSTSPANVSNDKMDNEINSVYKKLFFAGPKEDNSMLFSSDFLSKVPYSKMQEVLKSLFSNVGKYKGYEKIKDSEKIKLLFDDATCESILKLNDEGKIKALWFNNPDYIKINIEEVLGNFKKLEGKTSFTIRKNGKTLFSHNSKEPLAIGSAFKLYVLKTLVNRIKEGKDKWENVIYLDKSNFSMPSGFLHTWPDKDPITLATLANLMISVSDNTATDTLISYLGRENIEKFVTDINKPLLKTNEMFKLKGNISREDAEKYITKSVQEKRQYLEELKKLDLEKNVFPSTPTMIDKIEWLFSTEELCTIIESLKGEKAIGINNSGLVGKNWNYVGFKGGSEPGVINLTYVFEKNKDTYSFSATINNDKNEINNSEVFPLITQIVSAIYKNY